MSPEFISIPEWAKRLEISKETAYKLARTGQIPGCFAMGRLYRVNWPAFVERSGLAGGKNEIDEDLSDFGSPRDVERGTREARRYGRVA